MTQQSAVLSWRKVSLYGTGQLGVMLLARYFFQWLNYYSDSGKGTDTGALLVGTIVGMMFFAFRIFDGVSDPIAGALGDHWVAKGRQRRSLLWFSFLIPPFSLALIFAPNHAMPMTLRWVLMASGMFLFFVGYTLYAIPYWSLVDDYSQGDEKTRSRLSNSLGIGVLLATAITAVASPKMVQSMGYWGTAVALAVFGAGLMCLPYFAAPRGIEQVEVKKAPPLFQSLGASLKDLRFVRVIILFAGSQMSFTVMTASAAYIAVDLLHGDEGDVTSLMTPMLLAAFAIFPFVPSFARRVGWEKASLLASFALGAAYMGAGFLGQAIVGSAMTTAMIAFALAGPGTAFILGLEGEAIARSAELSEFKSTSMYFGVYNFIVKALNGLALFITSLLSAQNTVASVRAMPIVAGALCVSGVVLYLALGRLVPAAPTKEIVEG
ncbi:MAG: MFS transporter [Polyangiaceae bacterium]|nr:MFS transporter [Polyangiaceae bacterium]